MASFLCHNVLMMIMEFSIHRLKDIFLFYYLFPKDDAIRELYSFSISLQYGLCNHIWNKILRLSKYEKIIGTANYGAIIFATFNFIKNKHIIKKKAIFIDFFNEYNIKKNIKENQNLFTKYLQRKRTVAKFMNIDYTSLVKKKENVNMVFIKNGKTYRYFMRCFFCGYYYYTNEGYNCCLACKYKHIYDEQNEFILEQKRRCVQYYERNE